jgi:taurine dioxygenase
MAPFETAALTEQLGVEVSGLDTTAPLDPAARDALIDLFHQRQLLLIRSPVLTPHHYVRLIRSFGEPDPSDTSRYHEPIDVDGFKGLRLVSNIQEAGRNKGQFGNDEIGWHQDRWTDAAPPPATALHGVEITQNGGRTAIASLAYAYDTLPADLRARVDGRTIHFPLKVNDLDGTLDDADPDDPALFRTVPLVQQHDVTGRRFLFLGARRILAYIDTAPRISGLDRAQSAALLDALYAHLDRSPAYSHRWRQGDILLWDNRCCAHRRESFDANERRLLYGTPIVASDLLWQRREAAAPAMA